MEWRSNAKGNQEPQKGSTFHLKGMNMEITIHKYVGCGDNLFLSCRELGFSTVSLKTEDFDKAVETSKQLIKRKLDVLNKECEKFLCDNSKNEFSIY